jgi:glycosyltransferase involved in cell wall biosynthesis
MRLAIISSAPRGGLLQYAGQMADALAARGHEVDLIAPRDNELVGRLEHAAMRAVLAGPHQTKRPALEGLARLVKRARTALGLCRTFGRTLVEVRRGGYDAVVLTDDPDMVLTAAGTYLLVRLAGDTRVAAVCHEPRPRNRSGSHHLFVRRGGLHVFLERVYPRLDLVMLHGERSRTAFAETWPASHTAVVPHGDERIFGSPPPPSGEERVLFFGDWRRSKGLHVLMEAFDILHARRPSARLTIAGRPAGDGDPDDVRRWVTGHAPAVELIERYVAIDEVRSIAGRARVVVAPYLAGAQSGVVLLGMTMGRAIVASDVGDLGEAVVPGETGLLVPPGDAGALADALERVLADGPLAERLGRGGLQRIAAEFSWEHVAERLEGELDAVLRSCARAQVSEARRTACAGALPSAVR